MYFAAFDVDGLGGRRGAVVFTLAAADALVFMDGGDAVDHLDGLSGAMSLAEATTDAVVLEDHGIADADGCFLFFTNRLNSARGTELAAASAGKSAETLIESHNGLQESVEAGGRTQHMLGTFSNTKLAGGAAALKVLKADGASRFQRGLALGDGLVFNESHTCGGFLLLGVEHRGSAYSSCDGKKLATGRINSARFSRFSRISRNCYCTLFAVSETVETHHTAAAVDRLVLKIDAVGFAALLALATADALLAVNADTKE